MKNILVLFSILLLINCNSKNDYDKAIALYNNQNYKVAIALLNDLIKKHPENPLLYEYKGFAYNRLGNTDSAIYNLKKSIRLGANTDSEIFNQLGIAYSQTGVKDKSFDSFLVAYLLDSTNEIVNFNLSRSYYEYEEFSKALLFINNAIKINQKNADYYFFRGEILYKSNDYRECIKSIDKGLIFSTKNSYAYLFKGMSLYALNYFDEAISCFSSSIRINGNIADFYYQRACAYLAIGEVNKAISDCDKALQIDSSLSQVHYLKALILIKYVDKKKGCDYFNQYLSNDTIFLKDSVFDYCK